MILKLYKSVSASKRSCVSWSAVIRDKDTDHPCVEIRHGSFVCIVATDSGYNYNGYNVGPNFDSTVGTNIHIGSAGPIRMTFDEWHDFNNVIDEARLLLMDLELNK